MNESTITTLNKLLGIHYTAFEPFTSFRNSSIPNAGSPTYPVSRIDGEVLKNRHVRTINHHDGSVTLILKNPSLYIKFWWKK